MMDFSPILNPRQIETLPEFTLPALVEEYKQNRVLASIFVASGTGMLTFTAAVPIGCSIVVGGSSLLFALLLLNVIREEKESYYHLFTQEGVDILKNPQHPKYASYQARQKSLMEEKAIVKLPVESLQKLISLVQQTDELNPQIHSPNPQEG